jgi:hypothetical protein
MIKINTLFSPAFERAERGRAHLGRTFGFEIHQSRIDRIMKYVVVSGGVVSGLGKGVTASSVGVLLKASGLRVTSVKIDPYINIDAGTMSPFEHGETYVLDDGGESDLDLGNYERFVDVSLTRDHNITTGKVYQVRVIIRLLVDGCGLRARRRRRWMVMMMHHQSIIISSSAGFFNVWVFF